MPNADYYKPGDWNAICDGCGRKFKASELRRDWKGRMMCPAQWEPRQPQDFVKGVKDDMATPWSRPDPPPTYVNTGHSAIAGIAIAGNAISGLPF